MCISVCYILEGIVFIGKHLFALATAAAPSCIYTRAPYPLSPRSNKLCLLCTRARVRTRSILVDNLPVEQSLQICFTPCFPTSPLPCILSTQFTPPSKQNPSASTIPKAAPGSSKCMQINTLPILTDIV